MWLGLNRSLMISLSRTVGAAHVIAYHKLKRISIAAHHYVQLDCCTRKWDHRDCKGAGDEIINTCHQVIGSIGIGVYNSMVDVHEMVG